MTTAATDRARWLPLADAVRPLSEVWQWVGIASVVALVGGTIALAVVKAMNAPEPAPSPEAA